MTNLPHSKHDTPIDAELGAGCCGAVVSWLDRSGTLTPADVSWLDRSFKAALGHLQARGEVRVVCVGDAEMTAAHARSLGINETTDVLTFDLADGPATGGDPPALDADIMVCVDEARRRTPGTSDALRRELLLYALHGVLHCLGHDDHDDEGFDRMHAQEDAVLTAIGVGPVFRAGSAAGAMSGGSA